VFKNVLAWKLPCWEQIMYWVMAIGRTQLSVCGNDLGLTNGHSMGGHDPGVTNGHYLGGLIQVWPMAIIWVAWSKVWPMVIMWCNWDLGEILQHHWKLCRLSSRPHDVLSMCCGRIHLKESTLRSSGLEAGSLPQVTLLREEYLSEIHGTRASFNTCLPNN
jgi:hypothetical protein